MQKKGIIAATLLLFLAGGGIITADKLGIIGNKTAVTNTDNQSSEVQTTETEIVTEMTEPEEKQIPPVIVEKKNEDIHKGNLILVNRNYEYKEFDDTKLENIYSMKSNNYSVADIDMELSPEMIKAINGMLDDFAGTTGVTNVIANSGYRSYELQKEMYDDDLELTGNETSELVAPPGYSEHHTGYAMDFAVDDGEYYPALKNHSEYSWIYKNAHRYGMILRYTEENQYITGYVAESWHFRYLGVTHASLVRRMNVTYEEYIDFIKNFTYEEPLEYKMNDSEMYKIYFVRANTDEGGTTEIPINQEVMDMGENAYSISGNNVDGFIVTVKTDKVSDNYSDLIFDMFGGVPDEEEEIPVTEEVTEENPEEYEDEEYEDEEYEDEEYYEEEYSDDESYEE